MYAYVHKMMFTNTQLHSLMLFTISMVSYCCNTTATTNKLNLSFYNKTFSVQICSILSGVHECALYWKTTSFIALNIIQLENVI